MSTLPTRASEYNAIQQKPDDKDLRIIQLEAELAKSRQELIDFKANQSIRSNNITAMRQKAVIKKHDRQQRPAHTNRRLPGKR
jgi:hypothetical protein